MKYLLTILILSATLITAQAQSQILNVDESYELTWDDSLNPPGTVESYTLFIQEPSGPVTQYQIVGRTAADCAFLLKDAPSGNYLVWAKARGTNGLESEASVQATLVWTAPPKKPHPPKGWGQIKKQNPGLIR